MASILLPSFASGEISPELHARVDAQLYHQALRTARNCIVHPYGGVSNRPGSTFIAPVKDHTEGNTRLVEFNFSITDKYILEFGNLYMRVIKDDAQVTEAAKTITDVTQANPAVVTVASHGYSNGDTVFIDDVGGMTEINNRWFKVDNVTANTFELTSQGSDGLAVDTNIDSSNFGAYTTGGTAAKVFELTTPYASADLRTLRFVQSFDTITITHHNYDPRDLTRTGDTSWTLSVIPFEPITDHPIDVTVTANTTASLSRRYQVTSLDLDTGEESLPALDNTDMTITNITQANPAKVTSTSHGLVNGDEVEINSVVGMTEVNGRRFFITKVDNDNFTLDAEDSTSHTAYSSGGTANRTFTEITNSADPEDNTIDWPAVSGIRRYVVYRESNGLFGFIGETEKTSFEDDGLEPDLTISPPKARTPFLFANNFPQTSTYFQQRQIYGSTINEPDTFFNSRTGARRNMSFSIPARDDDAFFVTLTSNSVNDIRHFIPSNDLLILTDVAEWRVSPGVDSIYAPTTARLLPQSRWGSSHLVPQTFGPRHLFVANGDNKVRSLQFSFDVGGYISNDINRTAGHLLGQNLSGGCENTIVSWTGLVIPEPRVIAVRDDGLILTCTYEPDEQVVAWTTWDTKGQYEEVVKLQRGILTIEDALFSIVKRRVNGNVVRYIEKTAHRRIKRIEDGHFVDSGVATIGEEIDDITLSSVVLNMKDPSNFTSGIRVNIYDVEWDGDTDENQLNNETFEVTAVSGNDVTLGPDLGGEGEFTLDLLDEDTDPCWEDVKVQSPFSNTSGSPTDTGPDGRTLTLNINGGAIDQDVSGKIGSGIQFPGDNSDLQNNISSMSYEELSGGELELATNDFTLDMWIKFDGVGDKRSIWGGTVALGTEFGLVKEADDTLSFIVDGDTVGNIIEKITTDDTTAGKLSVSTWHHIAVTRCSNTFRFFVDGNKVTETTTSTSIGNLSEHKLGATHNIGYKGLNATVDNFRLTYCCRWTDNFATESGCSNDLNNDDTTSDVMMMLKLEDTSSPLTNEVSGFGDPAVNVVENSGAATFNITGKFADGLQLPGSGNDDKSGSTHIQANVDAGTFAEWSVFSASGDRTVDFWINHQDVTGVNKSIMGQWQLGNFSWYLRKESNDTLTWRIAFTSGTQSITSGAATIDANTWHHVALVKTGTTYKLFIDGTEEGSRTDADSIDAAGNNTFVVGVADSSTYDAIAAKFDNIRVTDNARWTTDFDTASCDINTTGWTEYKSCGIVFEAITELTGLWHLNTEEVVGIADGHPFTATVSDGKITLPFEAGRVHVGLAYTTDIETLNIEVPGARPLIDKLKRVTAVTTRFYKSVPPSVGPTSDARDLVPIKIREFEDMGEPIRLLDGDKRIYIEPSWNSNGRIFFRMTDPMPLTILGINPEFEVSDD